MDPSGRLAPPTRGRIREPIGSRSPRSTRSCIGLDGVAVPTLVLAGDCDAFAQGADRLASATPDARLELVPGNHVQVLHDVRYTTRMLSFLS